MQNTKRIVKDWLGAALLAAILCAGTVDAHAQTDARLQQRWNAANEDCRGAPLNNPACDRRNAIMTQLSARGWTLANHDVWYSRRQLIVVANLVSYLNAPGPIDARMQYAVDQLYETQLLGPEFIAIWNANSATFRDGAPGGWAILSEIAGRISRHFADDPRYQLDNQ
jgi:hypothetical protein